MSAFHEVEFPVALALGAVGGPERRTEIVRLASGREQRNARWAGSRRRWEIGNVVMRADASHQLAEFFEARRGRLHGFRFRDPADWKSCPPGSAPAAMDQPLGVGDGETTAFQLVKRYDAGDAAWDRKITKPVAGSVVVAIDGVATDTFDLDDTSGVVTFGTAPVEGSVLTAGFSFDTPVRFEMDRLEMAIEGFDAMRVMRGAVVEIVP